MPSEDLPANTSFWIRDYGSIQPAVRPLGSGTSSIAVEVIERGLLSTGGRLLQLRPRQALEEGRYVVVAGESVISEWLHVERAADDVAPAAAEGVEAKANTDPYEVCESAGVLVSTDPSDEWVLTFLETRDGLLEIGCPSCLMDPNGFIQTAENATVTFDVVHVDVAGNRSDAVTDQMGAAIGTPRVPTRGGGGVAVRPDRPSSCGCRSAERGPGSALSWLLMATLVRGTRRRRAGG